ncbi:hypothetical protein K438DRAFT_1751288 [Mycena galopus ATCC 62051]|nr:hypothetical protein K438DRAFT_1751288 [Mycena galopus ATCC 62051]
MEYGSTSIYPRFMVQIAQLWLRLTTVHYGAARTREENPGTNVDMSNGRDCGRVGQEVVDRLVALAPRGSGHSRVQCPVHSSLLQPLAEDVLDFVFKVEDIPGGVMLDVLLGPAAALLDVALVELPPEFGEDVLPEAGSESDPSSPILECGATFSE